MRLLFLVLLLAAALAGLGGCASDNDPNRVSTIPFNRPEPWEGQGAFGGYFNQGH